ncbi:MAG: LytR/AlgR family response regulator transcription factor [Chitinophagaceae bacterium]
MLQTIIVDDEPLALDLLEDNITKVGFLHLVAKCSNAFEALDVLKNQKIDLIFLDIQMPGLNGFELIQTLPDHPMVIVVTAFEKYALDGFKLNVLDYLLKPVSLERFVKACNRAWEYHLLQLSSFSDGPSSPEYFFVRVDYSQVKIVFAQIRWIEGWKDYVKIHLLGSDKPIITRMSLKSVEEQIPASLFIRIHKSFIVAIPFITSLRRASVFIGDLELPVGENYREAVHALTGKSGEND